MVCEARYNDDEDEDTDPRAYSRHNKDFAALRQPFGFRRFRSAFECQAQAPSISALKLSALHRLHPAVLRESSESTPMHARKISQDPKSSHLEMWFPYLESLRSAT